VVLRILSFDRLRTLSEAEGPLKRIVHKPIEIHEQSGLEPITSKNSAIQYKIMTIVLEQKKSPE